MARPKKLTLDFFVHSASARHDRRIKSLRRREKNDGYATYYILLEMSCSENEMKLHLDDEITVEEVVEECGLTESSHFYRIVNSCVSVGLFNKQLWDSQKIVFSDDLYNSYIDRLEDRKASAERKQRFSEAKSLQDKINEVTQENQVVTQENQVVTQENQVVTQENQVVTQDGTPEYRIQNYRTTELQSTEEKKEKKEEKGAETFFSETPEQNQAMQQELKSSVAIADQKDPTPVAPAPLSDAAIALKAKFEGRFERKAKKQWWERYVKHDDEAWREILTEWAFSETSSANFKESLIITQIDHLRKIPSACEPFNAINSLSNYIRNDDLTSFQLRVNAAIAYEKALAANPTLNKQDGEATDTFEPSESIVYQIDCRWEHYYPKKGKVNSATDEAEIVWGMINTHPPDPVDERLQRFLQKAQGDPIKLAKLAKAKHCLDPDVASYRIQAENFANAKDGLITALNQEIQKLLSSQAA